MERYRTHHGVATAAGHCVELATEADDLVRTT